MDSSEEKKRHWAGYFTEKAGKYAADPARALDFSNERLMRQVHRTVFKGIALEKGMKILDAGCGFGTLAEMLGADLQARDETAKIFCIDISPGMVFRATENALASHFPSHFLIMDMANLGFKENSFECSVCSESLQYSEPCAVLQEMMRVTVHRLIISLPNVNDPIIRRAIEKNDGRYTVMPLQALVALLKDQEKCSDIQVYPLIFTDDQGVHPYQELEFMDYNDVSLSQLESANRFVIKINLK